MPTGLSVVKTPYSVPIIITSVDGSLSKTLPNTGISGKFPSTAIKDGFEDVASVEKNTWFPLVPAVVTQTLSASVGSTEISVITFANDPTVFTLILYSTGLPSSQE